MGETREEIEARVRAEYEQKFRREEETRRMNDALMSARAAAASEPRIGQQANQPYRRGSNAHIYGAVLAQQMLAGDPGTGLADDGLGDGTEVHPDAA